MLQWISQVERTPLVDGDVSFHPLALRWLRSVDEYEQTSGEDQWPLVAKFFARLEASADFYWHVPQFELESTRNGSETRSHANDSADPKHDDEHDSHDDVDELYRAAYEDMTYRDSTDDGQDADTIDESTASEFELEEEAQRLGQRLEFLGTVA